MENKKEVKHNEINNRIDKLYGNDDSDIKKGKIKISASEQSYLKKKLIIVIIIICLLQVGLIIYMTKDTITTFLNLNSNNNQEQKDNVSIDVNSDIVQYLNGIITFDIVNPLYTNNILKLYEGNVKINDLDMEAKMLLVTSTTFFRNMFENNTDIKNYIPGAEENNLIIVSKKEINHILSIVLGNKSSVAPEKFEYYYLNEDNYIYFTATLEDGVYNFKEDSNIQLGENNVNVFSKLVGAEKKGKSIFLKYKTLFNKGEHIYRDKELEDYLCSDILNVYNYIENGSVYQFEFVENTDNENNTINYFLNSIVKVNN